MNDSMYVQQQQSKTKKREREKKYDKTSFM